MAVVTSVLEELCVQVRPMLVTLRPCAMASPSGLERSLVQPAPLTPVQVEPQPATLTMKSLLPESVSDGAAHEVQLVESTLVASGVAPLSSAMAPVAAASKITAIHEEPVEEVIVKVPLVWPAAELRQ